MWYYMRNGGNSEVGDLVGLGEEKCETEWGRGMEGIRRLDLVQKVEQGVSLIVVAAVGEKQSQGLRGRMDESLLHIGQKVVTWA